MDPERPHGSSIRDLFICFTSGHYFSRRIMVRNNSSLKNGEQKTSPMFSNGKKKGPGFENPEPSSPKVTCIGQVRVNKSKKQGSMLRDCSRSNYGGDCRRWVHLPMTICEALRAFGAEYVYCLLPCTRSSSCMANNKEDKTGGRSGKDRARVCVSSSSPPMDALLLTRCRSVLLKMAAFADQICWETREIAEIKEDTLTQASSDAPERVHEEEEGSNSNTEAMGPDPGNESKQSGNRQNPLPDCLMLMMCEPKLSMEVSKETWVCRGDFINKQPLVKQKEGVDEPPVLLQPPAPEPSSSLANDRLSVKQRDGVDPPPAAVASSSWSLAADPPLVMDAISACNCG
ncbi:hypothetical protein F3Y22_tig00111852pilonHSYRG00007 [Hibiscus syriacus]|uniref:Uncharacterized protein n=1 Tax=Hibiscus syriacus TaxID=106335 RepID=A0A6A2YFB1_HIBSY|nr:hypothetical protein F3Y22_tig00111852pilonHSYRG00007 [Hibiscus syriacus]